MGTESQWCRRSILVGLWLTLFGCSGSTTDPAEYPGFSLVGTTVFISRPEVNGANMEALYYGAVVKDPMGCLRLQPSMDATVVWPHGSTLEVRPEGEWVLDEKGKEVGAINGMFRFGGGFVPALQSSLGFTEMEITAIHDRCPGRFWIVGEFLSP